MSFLSDVLLGKEITFGGGGKLTILYKEDANALAINGVVLTGAEVAKLQKILSVLKMSKQLESEV